MANSVNENVQFEDMGTNTPASEIAQRGQQLQQQSTQFKESAGDYFDQESMTMKQQAALDDSRKKTAQMKQAMNFRQQNFDAALADAESLEQMQAGAKQQLVDNKIKFMRDASGRKMIQESQLQDWMIAKGVSQEEWEDYAQKSEMYHQRKIQLLQVAKAKIEQAEKQSYIKFVQGQDQGARRYIAERKAEVEKKLEAAKRKSANNSMIISGLSTVGMAAGAIIGTMAGPAGSMAGAAAGAAIGGLVGTGLGTVIANNQ
jgi:hypothetical protein